MLRSCLLLILSVTMLSMTLAAQEAKVASSPVSSGATGSQPGPADEDLIPNPSGPVSLVGGTILSVDHVHDRISLRPFGAGPTNVLFDPRTEIYDSERKGTAADLKDGERIYIDTIWDGSHIYARSIRVGPSSGIGESNGQIVSYDPGTGNLTVRDSLSSEAVNMRIIRSTVIVRHGQPASPSDLVPGTLITLSFDPESSGQPKVRHLSILARPGAGFVFAGRISYLNRARKLLAIVDPRDQKSYDIHFGPSTAAMAKDLREGTEVTIEATFDGDRYVARTISVNPPTPNQ